MKKSNKNKKKEIKSEELHETPHENQENENPQEENPTDEIDKEEATVAELEEKVKTYEDKYLRLFSEFDNYRKRTLKEKTELSNFATANLVTDILSVIDDFERALKSFEDNSVDDSIKKGIELVFNKLYKILEQQGLKSIQAEGEIFNTDYHEAVTKIPAEADDMKGKVFDVVQKGYMMHDKVIRYAKVVVAE